MVLFEDNHLLIVNKPCGTLVQGDKTGDIPLVEEAKFYIKNKYNKPGDVFLGIPHRLDRPTSGVLIFARTSKALVRLNEMFKQRAVKKTYWAVVKNKPINPAQKLIHFMSKNQERNKSIAKEKEFQNSSKAILNYELLKSSDHYHLLEINLETGRHHQIRAQLSAIGLPIKGDLKYGFDRPNKDKSIHLHARSIEFIHPVSKDKISITATVPNEPLWLYFQGD